MTARVVYTGVSDGNGVQGTLFRGIKFWLSQKVPQRSRFVADVEANGGEVLPLENQADLKIVDHAKQRALPGTSVTLHTILPDCFGIDLDLISSLNSYSYTYIEKSIRNGVLEDIADHAVGPPAGTIRKVGSATHPTKGTRTPFTREDDKILWQWVQESKQKGGGTDGNEIYKQLEAMNPRHPWQSWRDRFVKYLKGTRPDFSVQHIPVLEHRTVEREPKNRRDKLPNKSTRKVDFTSEERNLLYELGKDILEIDPAQIKAAWEMWTTKYDVNQNHSASEWQDYWERTIRPIYLDQQAEGTNSRSTSSSRSQSPDLGKKPRVVTLMIPSPHKRFRSTSPGKSSSSLPDTPRSPRNQSLDIQPIQQSKQGNRTAPNIKRSDTSDSHDFFNPDLEAQDGDNKRKRVTNEDEMPSSSPTGREYPIKKQRRDRTSLPAEIASTPNQSPVHQRSTTSPERKDKHTLPFKGLKDRGNAENEDEEVGSAGLFLTDHASTEEDNQGLGQQASPVLSEPEHIAHPTQAIFNNETPTIDLDVPPPEEGWDDEESSDNNSKYIQQTFGEPNAQLLDTQALLNSTTQIPDFSLPDPDGGWDVEDVPSSPQDIPGSPLPKNISQDEINARLDAWIDAHVAAGRPADDVILALERTSLDHRLADEVLEYMAMHKGRIPKNVRGVWTDSDDNDMDSTDARRIERLEEKHGSLITKLRWNYLEACQK